MTLPLLLLLLGRIRPSIHFRNMIEPMVMAFSTSSSAATLPVTLRAVENKVGVSNKVTSFVLPMGSTINMDGTAVYECAGVLFIAQALGADLSFMQQMIVVMTALLASIGAAAVPSAGLVIIFLVLSAVGLEGPEVDAIVGAMFAIDRPLDMARTVVNVFSDSCGAAIIARSEGEDHVDREVAVDIGGGRVSRLNMKRVLVTGAARGLGKAIAERFAGEGAEMVLTDLDGENLEAAREELASTGGAVAAPIRSTSPTRRHPGGPRRAA